MLHGNGTGNSDGQTDVLSDRKMATPGRPPVIHLTRLDDRSQSSSPLFDGGWWMDDKNMVRARQSNK